MGFGQDHPDDGCDQKEIGAGQPNINEPSEVAGRLKQVCENKTGRDMKHHQDADEQHLQRKPFEECGLQKDEHCSAGDSEKGRRRGHSHIDESGQAVESVELWSDRNALPLPKQKR